METNKFKSRLLPATFLLLLSSLLYSEDIQFQRFDRDQMGVFYKEAETYKEEFKWNSTVNRGKEVIEAEWEKRMWADLVRSGIPDDQAVQDLGPMKAEWEKEADADILLNRGIWKADQLKADIQTQIDQTKITEIEGWADQAKQEADALGPEQGLEKWVILQQNITSEKNAQMQKLQDKIQTYPDLGSPEENKGFMDEMSLQAIVEYKSWEWNIDSKWVSKQNGWIMLNVRDESLRQEYESKTAENVVRALSQSARENADKQVESTLQKQADSGEWHPPSPDDPKNYEQALTAGLQEWSDALANFYSQWQGWRAQSQADLAAGQAEWLKGYDELKAARDEWLARTQQTLQDGQTAWQDKIQQLADDRLAAEQELQKYNTIEQQAWQTHTAGIKDALLSGNTIIGQADDNIAWLQQKTSQNSNEWALVENQISALKDNLAATSNDYSYWKGLFEQGTVFITNYIDGFMNYTPTVSEVYVDQNGDQFAKSFVPQKIDEDLTLMDESRQNLFSITSNADRFESAFLYYQADLAQWKNIRTTLVDTAVQAENLYHNSDMLGNPGLFTDSRMSDSADLYFMSQAELQLQNLKTDKQTWSNELVIAQAVKDYAFASGGAKEKKDATESALANASAQMALAITNYDHALAVLNNVVKSSMQNLENSAGILLSAVQTAKSALDQASRNYEIARTGLMIIEDPSLLTNVKQSLNDAARNLMTVRTQIPYKLEEYASAVGAYVKADRQYGLSYSLQVIQDEKDATSAAFTILSGLALTSENDVMSAAQNLNDQGLQVWGNEANAKKAELDSLINAVESAQDPWAMNAAKFQIGVFIQNELRLAEAKATAAQKEWDFLRGAITTNVAFAECHQMENNWNIASAQISFDSSKLLKNTLGSISISGISTIDGFKNAILTGLTNSSSSLYAKSTVLQWVDSKESELEQIISFATNKTSAYSTFMLGPQELCASSSNTWTELQTHDISDPAVRQSLVYSWLEKQDNLATSLREDVIGQNTANALLSGPSSYALSSLVYDPSTATGYSSIITGLRDGIQTASWNYGDSIAVLSSLYDSAGVSVSDLMINTSDMVVMDKAGILIQKLDDVIRSGYADSALTQVYSDLNSRLSEYKFRKYMSETGHNPQSELANLQNQMAVWNQNVSTMVDVVVSLTQKNIPVYDSSGDALQKLLTCGYYITNASATVRNAANALSSARLPYTWKSAVMDYQRNYSSFDPDAYVNTLSELTPADRQNVKSAILPFHVLSEYGMNRAEIIQSNAFNGSIAVWVDSFAGLNANQRNWIKTQIEYSEYQTLNSDMISRFSSLDINSYAAELRPFLEAAVSYDFVSGNTNYHIDTPAGRQSAARDILHSRTDMGTNSADIARVSQYLFELNQNAKRLSSWLPNEVQLQKAEENYFSQHGTADTVLRDITDIDAFCQSQTGSGTWSGLDSGLKSFIDHVGKILGFQSWSDPSWYVQNKWSGGDEEQKKTELVLSMNGFDVLSPSYDPVIFSYASLVRDTQDIIRKSSDFLCALNTDMVRISGLKDTLVSDINIRTRAIAEAGLDQEKSWRDYLVKASNSPAAKNSLGLVTDGQNNIKTSNPLMDSARDSLENLRQGVLSAAGQLKSYQNLQSVLMEVRNAASSNADMQVRASGYSSDKSAKDALMNNSLNAYQGLLSMKLEDEAGIFRNGKVLDLSLNISAEQYRNTVLKQASDQVNASQTNFNNAQSLYADSEQKVQDARSAYINQMNVVSGLSGVMDSQRLDYRCALAKYEYAVNEYVYAQSDSVLETPLSASVPQKRDAVDEYNRVLAQFNQVNSAYVDKLVEVNAQKSASQMLVDSSVKDEVSAYQELWNRISRVASLVKKLESVQGTVIKEADQARNDYETAKNDFFNAGPDNNLTNRDKLLMSMLNNNTYDGSWAMNVASILKDGQALSGNDKFVYDNVTTIKNAITSKVNALKAEVDSAVFQSKMNSDKLGIILATSGLTACLLTIAAFPFSALALWTVIGSYSITLAGLTIDYGNQKSQYDDSEKNRASQESACNSYIIDRNGQLSRIQDLRTSLQNKLALLQQYNAATNLNQLVSTLSGSQFGLTSQDMNFLSEVGATNCFNISALKTSFDSTAIDSIDKAGTLQGYNIYSVIAGYSSWLQDSEKNLFAKLESDAVANGYSPETVLKMKEQILHECQQTSVALGRGDAGYGLITDELLKLGDTAFAGALDSQSSIQTHEWDMKTLMLADEKSKWDDTMTLVMERGNLQWEKASARYLRDWKSWYLDTSKALSDKEKQFSDADKSMKSDRDSWMKDLISGGIQYRQGEIAKMVQSSLDEINSGNHISSVNGHQNASAIIGTFRPEEISTKLVLAAHCLDMGFSIDNMNAGSMFNDSTGSMFASQVKAYTTVMDRISKERLLETLSDQLKGAEHGFEDALSQKDHSYGSGMAGMYQKDDFIVSSMNYSRRVVSDSTLIGGNQFTDQTIGSYQLFRDYSIPWTFLMPQNTGNIADSEMQLYCQREMDKLKSAYGKKAEKLDSYFGVQANYNDKGELTDSGSGEYGRLVRSLVDADKEKAQGLAKADLPFYRKDLAQGLPVSLDTVAKVGLSLVPGGQLIALSMTIAESGYEVLAGKMSLGQAAMNLATGAVSACVGWAGQSLGGLVQGAIGVGTKAAVLAGNMSSTLITSAFNAGANVVNKGFQVESDGSLSYKFDDKKMTSAGQDFWKDMAVSTVGGFAGNLVSSLSLSPEQLSAMQNGVPTGQMSQSMQGQFNLQSTYANLTRSLVSEGVNSLYTGKFNVSVANLGGILDFMRTGKNTSPIPSGSILDRFADNIYNSDAGVQNLRNLGMGITISGSGIDINSHTSGGFDLGEVTSGVLARGIMNGVDFLGKGIKNLLNNNRLADATTISALRTPPILTLETMDGDTRTETIPGKDDPTEQTAMDERMKGNQSNQTNQADKIQSQSDVDKRLYADQNKSITDAETGMQKWSSQKGKAEQELSKLKSQKDKYKTPAAKKIYANMVKSLQDQINVCNKYYNNSLKEKNRQTLVLNKFQEVDKIVDEKVSQFNQDRGYKPGDVNYLDPNLIKVQIRQEVNNSTYWLENDPMQINNGLKDKNGKTDWDPIKATLGLSENKLPGKDLSIEAGIQWLEIKKNDFVDQATFNRTKNIESLIPIVTDWEHALQAYNANYKTSAMQGNLFHAELYMNKIWSEYEKLYK